MATWDDIRRIATARPETTADHTGSSYAVAGKAICWTWLERIDPKQARVPNPSVVAVRVAHESEKELLIDMDPDVFFTEPHYNGFPAILVRLAAVDVDTLERLLVDAWRLRAPKKLVAAMERPQRQTDG